MRPTPRCGRHGQLGRGFVAPVQHDPVAGTPISRRCTAPLRMQHRSSCLPDRPARPSPTRNAFDAYATPSPKASLASRHRFRRCFCRDERRDSYRSGKVHKVDPPTVRRPLEPILAVSGKKPATDGFLHRLPQAARRRGRPPSRRDSGERSGADRGANPWTGGWKSFDPGHRAHRRMSMGMRRPARSRAQAG